MRKPPITRVPAIQMDLINRPIWRTDGIYAEIAKWQSNEWLQWMTMNDFNDFRSIQNSDEENGRSSQFLLVYECISVSWVIRCLKVGTYLSNKGLTCLLTYYTQPLERKNALQVPCSDKWLCVKLSQHASLCQNKEWSRHRVMPTACSHISPLQ